MSSASEAHVIRAVLQARGPAAAITLTDEQVAAIGQGAKTPPVRVTVNGHTFEGRIGRMGGESLLGFNKAVREACGVQAGDEVEATVVLDLGPREVEVPAELAAALGTDADARRTFDGLAYSRRKELARWVGDAAREATRLRRAEQALAQLREGAAGSA